MFLKELIFNSFYFGRVMVVLDRTDFLTVYTVGKVWWS